MRASGTGCGVEELKSTSGSPPVRAPGTGRGDEECGSPPAARLCVHPAPGVVMRGGPPAHECSLLFAPRLTIPLLFAIRLRVLISLAMFVSGSSAARLAELLTVLLKRPLLKASPMAFLSVECHRS